MKKIKHMKSSHILAVSFLLFIFYVGLAAFPQFLSNTRDAFSDGFSLRAYIRSIDDQYKGMLTAVQETPLLQNKGTYINLNGLMANVLDQPFMNERVKLTNGHLADTAAEEIPAETVKQVADNLIRFSRKQTEGEKTFLFVLAPSQIDPENDLLPAGYTDTANKTADTLLRFWRTGTYPVWICGRRWRKTVLTARRLSLSRITTGLHRPDSGPMKRSWKPWRNRAPSPLWIHSI